MSIEQIGQIFNPYKQFIGSFLPNWLLERNEISLGAKVVYAKLAQFAGENGKAYPTIKKLSISVGCPEISVKRYIKELIDVKLIKVDYHKEQSQASDYFFIWHEWIENFTTPSYQIDTPSYQIDTPSYQIDTPSYQIDTGIRESIKRINNNIYPSDFETFWKVYPKKVSKLAAYEQWKKIKPPLDLILQALEWQVETKKWKDGFILDPERYIKRRSWEDEPQEKVCPLPDLGYVR